MVIDALLKNINLLCKGVIVVGIKRKAYFNKLRHVGVFVLQGFLWPSVCVDSLQALQAMPGEFNNTNICLSYGKLPVRQLSSLTQSIIGISVWGLMNRIFEVQPELSRFSCKEISQEIQAARLLIFLAA
ncbi:hypothetical protein M5G07_10515 [Serratia symbiotica]|nr:hypothetical protein [Serratia symbiotica]